MAKDPAVLWYWNDWQGGTATFTRHLKGCYIDLLHAQFNSGRLSLQEIKTVLGADFGQTWPTLQKKFAVDEAGLYYNKRMEIEKKKRQRFTEGRQKNLAGKKNSHMDIHMANSMDVHMDNENEDGDQEEKKIGQNGPPFQKWETMPLPADVLDLTSDESILTVEFIARLKKLTLTAIQVNEFWQAYKIVALNGTKFYANREDVVQHFRNWLKNQDGNNFKGSGADDAPKSGTSSDRVNALKNW